MTSGWGIFLGAVAIAVAVFFGLWGFRKDVSDKLSSVNEKLAAIGVTADKVWDFLTHQFSHGTIERTLGNLGRTRITAEPGVNMTTYTIEIERPILQQELLTKIFNEKAFLEKERGIFGKDIIMTFTVFSDTRMRLIIPCTEPKPCTEYMTLWLKWLDSTYFAALPQIKNFEDPILS
jgi:hypothetical protein